ncbi:MAG: hypothetical protein ACUVTO_08055 [Candidatus Caldatribacteriaceae bacterium]
MNRTFLDSKRLCRNRDAFSAVWRKHALRLLDGIFYKFVNNPQVRKAIAQKGFCQEHARLLFSLRPSILGMAIVYHDLLVNYLNEYQEPSSRLVWKMEGEPCPYSSSPFHPPG